MEKKYNFPKDYEGRGSNFKSESLYNEIAIGVAVIALNKKFPNDQDFAKAVRNLVNSFKK